MDATTRIRTNAAAKLRRDAIKFDPRTVLDGDLYLVAQLEGIAEALERGTDPDGVEYSAARIKVMVDRAGDALHDLRFVDRRSSRHDLLAQRTQEWGVDNFDLDVCDKEAIAYRARAMQSRKKILIRDRAAR